MQRLLLSAIIAWICAGPVLSAECRDDVVYLRNETAELRFSVELAVTGPDRSRGLMFRESLPRQSGMLFVFERPQPVSFWMKNTLIPLDMIFVDRAGVVTRVHHRAVPGDTTPIPGGDAVYSVLEINGGLARDYGIVPGTLLRHRVFQDGPAAWPC